MKKIFLSIAFLMAVTMAFSQATTKVQTDTLRIFQVGGHTAEIVIENSTKNITGGFLQNKGNGRTQFALAVDSVYQDSSGLHLRKGTTWTNITFPNAILYTGSGGVNVNSTTKEITAPGKVDYISMRNDSLFYNKGGVEYYAGKTNAITPAWGTLSGTLSDQTDLQDALDAITDSLVLKLRISDTANMLSKYLRKADTSTLDARIRAIKTTQDSLTFGSGLTRLMNEVSATYYVPMWNANRIQGYYVDAGRPGNGYFLGFDSSNGIYRAMKPDSVVGALGAITQSQLDDTAAAIRADFPASGGSTPTFQQVIDAGSTMTSIISITGGNNDFEILGLADLTLNSSNYGDGLQTFIGFNNENVTVKASTSTDMYMLEGNGVGQYVQLFAGTAAATDRHVIKVKRDEIRLYGLVSSATAIKLFIDGLPVYSDDSAAGTGGLTANRIYKTSTGELRIKL